MRREGSCQESPWSFGTRSVGVGEILINFAVEIHLLRTFQKFNITTLCPLFINTFFCGIPSLHPPPTNFTSPDERTKMCGHDNKRTRVYSLSGIWWSLKDRRLKMTFENILFHLFCSYPRVTRNSSFEKLFVLL